MDIIQNYKNITKDIGKNVTVVAVSKTKPHEMIADLFHAGHKDFGENKVQDLVAKYELLPKEIKWHMIGHLQTNKVKYIAPFVYLIHSVDSIKLLKTINKEAEKNDRVINCLLQVHIAKEYSKFGLDSNELESIIGPEVYGVMKNVRIVGLMGMATFTDDFNTVRKEFQHLKLIFDKLKKNYFKDKDYFTVLSMGMSSDYKIAVEEGSNMVRVGSLIFGERNYT